MSNVKERPILFSAPMVKALLEGRKTQTRRVIKPQPEIYKPFERVNSKHWGWRGYPGENGELEAFPSLAYDMEDVCPIGKIGDCLWVRESLYLGEEGTWFYKADGSPVTLPVGHPSVGAMLSWAHHKDTDTCSSIHMPRWASRILLEITDVGYEQVQEISELDAEAEGISTSVTDPSPRGVAPILPKQYSNASEVYKDLWDSINGNKPGLAWKDNPWVWVLTFNRVTEAPQ